MKVKVLSLLSIFAVCSMAIHHEHTHNCVHGEDSPDIDFETRDAEYVNNANVAS